MHVVTNFEEKNRQKRFYYLDVNLRVAFSTLFFLN